MQIDKTCFVSVVCIYLNGLQSLKLSFPPPSPGSCCFPLMRGTQKLPYWVRLGKSRRCCPLKTDFCNDVGQISQQQPEEPELSNNSLGNYTGRGKTIRKKNPNSNCLSLNTLRLFLSSQITGIQSQGTFSSFAF